MKSTIFQQLIGLTRAANADVKEWLVGARQGVQFLEETCRTRDEIVLFALGPHCLVQSVLVPHTSVNPPDHEDLSEACIRSSDTWCIQQTYNDTDGHRIHLEPPLSSSGSQTLVGGERLVFGISLRVSNTAIHNWRSVRSSCMHMSFISWMISAHFADWMLMATLKKS